MAAGLLAPLALAAILVPFRAHFQNTEAALALVVVIVAVAAAGNRLAGYLAALSAAAWFDFFLTRPYETFDITGRYDIQTTVLLLVIGVAVTELAVWGRREHTAASRRAGYLDGIGATVEAVAAGEGPSELIGEVSGQLTRVLSLRSCRWQYGVAGLGHPARLKHTGQVVTRGRAWDVAAAGLPPSAAPTWSASAMATSSCSRVGRVPGTGMIRNRPCSRPPDSASSSVSMFCGRPSRSASHDRRGTVTRPS